MEGFAQPTAQETFDAFRAKTIDGDRIDLWKEDLRQHRRTRLGSYVVLELADIHRLFGAGDYQIRLMRRSPNVPDGSFGLITVCKINLSKEFP